MAESPVLECNHRINSVRGSWLSPSLAAKTGCYGEAPESNSVSIHGHCCAGNKGRKSAGAEIPVTSPLNSPVSAWILVMTGLPQSRSDADSNDKGWSRCSVFTGISMSLTLGILLLTWKMVFPPLFQLLRTPKCFYLAQPSGNVQEL